MKIHVRLIEQLFLDHYLCLVKVNLMQVLSSQLYSIFIVTLGEVHYGGPFKQKDWNDEEMAF